MKKYSIHEANNVFANLRRAFRYVLVGDNINFMSDKMYLRHGKVKSKWCGNNPRLVVIDDFGKMHYLRDLSGVSIFSKEVGGYIPAAAYGALYS